MSRRICFAAALTVAGLTSTADAQMYIAPRPAPTGTGVYAPSGYAGRFMPQASSSSYSPAFGTTFNGYTAPAQYSFPAATYTPYTTGFTPASYAAPVYDTSAFVSPAGGFTTYPPMSYSSPMMGYMPYTTGTTYIPMSGMMTGGRRGMFRR